MNSQFRDIFFTTPATKGNPVRACRSLLSLKVAALAAGISLLYAPAQASGQLLNVADDTSTPIPGSGHDYIHMLSETINPANGAVSLRIQLPTPNGRGLNFPFAITYDSGKVHHFVSAQTGYGGFTGDFSASAGGWGNTMPLLSHFTWNISIPVTSGGPSGYYCYYSTGYMFQDFSGTQHPLGLAVVANEAPNGAANCTTLSTTTKSRYGASMIALGGDGEVTASYPASACGAAQSTTLCNNGNPPVTITDLNGNVFTFKMLSTLLSLDSGSTSYYWPDAIEDRNGNQVTIAASSNYTATVTDTLNNPVVTTGAPASGNHSNVPTSYKVAGLTYGVTYTTAAANYSVPTSQTGSVRSTDSPCSMQSAISEGSSDGQAHPQTVVHAITLPNGQQYTFYYGQDNPNPDYANPYGLISEIDYPDGGWVRYTWKLSDTYAELATFDALIRNGGPGQGDPNACNYQYKIPVVATRTVGYAQDSGAAQTQSFTYETGWNSNNLGWATKTTKVSTTDNVIGKSKQTVYSYVDCNCSSPEPPDLPFTSAAQLPVEQNIQYYDWSNSTTPVLTVTKAWFDTHYLNCEFDTPSTQQSTGHFYTYTYGQLSDDKQYDFGQISSSACAGQLSSAPTSPAPARERYRPIQGFTSPLFNVNGLGPTFGEPQKETIYDHGSALAETDYSYDYSLSGSMPFTASATNHDETNFGSNVVANRGNVTSVTNKCLYGCSADAVTTFAYDQTGQVRTKTSPCGNTSCTDISAKNFTTSYSYADSNSTNAYLTTRTYPAPYSFIETFGYNYTQGLLTSSTDINKQQTSYLYGTQPSLCSEQDRLSRLSEIDYADGGKTQYCYNDSAPSVETNILLGGSSWKSSLAVSDGMGHVTHTELDSDPNGTDYVVSSYDGEGQVISTSNPFRGSTSNAPSNASSSFYFDALGRPIATVNQDGSHREWCYNGIASQGMPSGIASNCSSHLGSVAGAWVDFTDENGNHWQRTSDGFGRLVEVMEPNGSAQTAAMETDYTYDALNNLLSVTQWGGSNGAAGASSRNFSYDSLSRLTTATNPETNTITYVYDANGNVQTKTFPAPNKGSGTETIIYSYDALNRLVGKRYSETSTPSSCYFYDDPAVPNGVGRLSEEWTQTGPCPSAQPTAYITMRSFLAYDVMGRVISEQQCIPNAGGMASCTTSPSTTFGQAYDYNLAGNLTAYTNGVNNVPTAGTIAFGLQYDGAGRLQNLYSSWNPATNSSSGLVPLFTVDPSNGYSAAGAIQNVILGNNIFVNKTYDNRLRVTGETATHP